MIHCFDSDKDGKVSYPRERSRRLIHCCPEEGPSRRRRAGDGRGGDGTVSDRRRRLEGTGRRRSGDGALMRRGPGVTGMPMRRRGWGWPGGRRGRPAGRAARRWGWPCRSTARPGTQQGKGEAAFFARRGHR
ncbi:hypothetical protein D1007_05118 [Hordeum vulgare]|nr:hypothetical protein D1007_05118 [Hordeum vulgare]